mmetsp:Transcript_13079/g.20760  ORF Transcript_13079/g.20760 Transcript_13079/m.20760 type:complete len:169 (+) Transcript_13079:101-607(+)
MTVEIGPVSHSTVRAKIYEKTKRLLLHALDYIELHNQYIQNPTDPSIEKVTIKLPVAERRAQIDYPRDELNRLVAFVHPDLQGVRELSSLHPIINGAPVFHTLSGETLYLDVTKLEPIRKEYPLSADETYYPMFINEAAYYEKGVAFYLTQITEREVSFLKRVDSKEC